jgi:hypothetical protein
MCLPTQTSVRTLGELRKRRTAKHRFENVKSTSQAKKNVSEGRRSLPQEDQRRTFSIDSWFLAAIQLGWKQKSIRTPAELLSLLSRFAARRTRSSAKHDSKKLPIFIELPLVFD